MVIISSCYPKRDQNSMFFSDCVFSQQIRRTTYLMSWVLISPAVVDNPPQRITGATECLFHQQTEMPMKATRVEQNEWSLLCRFQFSWPNLMVKAITFVSWSPLYFNSTSREKHFNTDRLKELNGGPPQQGKWFKGPNLNVQCMLCSLT